MNCTVVGQLLSITTILLAGPAVVVLLALNKGNL